MAQNHGLIPPASVFKAKGLQGMLVTISTTYGGLRFVRERMGVSDKKFCTSCGQTLAISSFRLRPSNTNGWYRDSVCTVCSNTKVDEYRSTWPGRAADMCRRSQERARKLNREFDLSKEWVLKRMIDSNFKCEVSGVNLTSTKKGSGVGFRNRFGASLDRIDSLRGYTKDNVRVVATRMNIALGDLSDDQFEEFAIGFLRCRGWVLTPPGGS